MEKKELKKLIKSEFKDIRDTYGFFLQSDTEFLKVTQQNVLCNITFELMDMMFTCDVAIQPLFMYDYSPVLSLSMGERLNRVKVNFIDTWDYEHGEESLNEIRYYLLKNGIPWFEKYGSPEGIVKFILTDLKKEYYEYGFQLFRPFLQYQYLGFSLLYIGRISEGLFWLEELTKRITDKSVYYLHKYKQEVLEIMNTIRANPEKTKELLDKFAEDNKRTLKL